MESSAVQAGQVYKHFKEGTLYEVVCIATHSETDEEMVIYQDQASGKCFCRPLEMFIGYKEEKGGRIKRFVLTST